MSSSEADVVLALLELADTAATPDHVRSRLRALLGDAADSPALVLEQLTSIAKAEIAWMSTEPPDSILYRATSLETFQRYCAKEEWRPPGVGFEEFRRHVEVHIDPGAFLLSTVDASSTVFPAAHSWLVASDTLAQLSGAGLVAALQLDKQAPPFALCVLSPARMNATGVRVRRPTAMDAILGRHTVWNVEGVPGGQEFVDLDVPGAAIEAVLWRP